jgi:hypothetical protein
MSDKKTVFNWQLFFGFVLVVTGGLFLADQLIDELNLMETFWPLLIVLLGVTFFVGMLVAGKRGSGLAIPGSIITTLGLLLFIQNLFSLWETWAYAWALLITAVGFGLLVMNLYLKRLALRRVAGLIIGIGLTLFVVFGVLFEVVFFSNRPDSGSGYFLGAGLVLLGLFVLFSRAIFAKRKTTAVEEPTGTQEPVDVVFADMESVPEVSEEAVKKIPEDAVFTGLKFKSVGEIFLTQGDTCDLKIEGSEELLKDIQTEVGEDFLIIRYKRDVKDWMKFTNFSEERKLRYFITMEKIQHLDMGGAGSLIAEGLQGESLSIGHSGFGRITLKGLQYKSLDVDLGGLGEIIVDGEVQDQDVNLGGAGSYKAESLKSQVANVTLTGAGSARVWVESELNATVSGAGSIRYKGDPQVEQSKTGLGSIEPLK